MSKPPMKPGTPAPVSGQYRIRGTTTERTVVRGEPLPPTLKPGQKYVLEDKTKTK